MRRVDPVICGFIKNCIKNTFQSSGIIMKLFQKKCIRRTQLNTVARQSPRRKIPEVQGQKLICTTINCGSENMDVVRVRQR